MGREPQNRAVIFFEGTLVPWDPTLGHGTASAAGRSKTGAQSESVTVIFRPSPSEIRSNVSIVTFVWPCSMRA